MQILSTYKFLSSAMIELDYLQYSLVYFYDFTPLMLDTLPAVTRESCHRIKKPRSSYADNPHV